jgi:maleate isomerase
MIRPIGYGERARIGMLLPSGNISAEAELAAIVPHGVSLHVTRLPLNGSSQKELLGMTEGVERAAMLLADTRPSLIVFHCTAVSTWDRGMDARLCRRIGESTATRATTTAQGIVAALRLLNARKVVLITPYIDEINEREVRFLSHLGVTVLKVRALGLHAPAQMYEVQPERWRDLAVEARDDEADAYFISCTAIRALPIIAETERILGRPVITSNQVAAWHALRSCGIEDRLTDAGRLFSA